ncbi:protein-glutamate methylesterase/protein-glutamine glutaminase [Aquibacillus saliphilus]|uniref:protein-glutamate methylesterase/protein-glutamine glutaminase n=1 Tax=Aquibacillus saliphilus TaxID=1909422 RepID=UPI001CF0A144|nr:chemotaxis response regulator protein-glutamate methylesterase [Aquibacillus saliphilus]
MDKIKVLVVDDSAFMRKMISDILNSNPGIIVVGTARNGEDALIKIMEVSPDVITLDVEMPIMDGISTLKQIMLEMPIPVVMLSSLTLEGAEKTIEAMSIGAVDFIAKPSGSISLDIERIKEEIVNKVMIAAEVTIEKHKISIKKPTYQKSTNHKLSNEISTTSGSGKMIVAIGTSTGGPRALQGVLTNLPENFSAPILVVQHMPAGFTKSLANRLNSLAKIHIKEAVDGEFLLKGTAYIAPGGYHLKAKQVGRSLVAHVSQAEPVNGHQPSVDVLFESLANQQLYQVCAVIMTGMGSDGSKALKTLKNIKPNTMIIAEAEQTAIVFGMPNAAIKTNLVDFIEELENIGDLLVSKIKTRER